jgi:hypothetical protein
VPGTCVFIQLPPPHANTAQASVPLLATYGQIANKPSLKLGRVDCEANEILCTAWSVGVPAVWHFLTPDSALSYNAPTDVRIIRFNSSSVTTEDITSIPSHSGANPRYKKYEPYTGMLHPIDSTLARFGLSMPVGYALWLLGAIPSWAMMLVISMVSRQIMSKRMAEGPPSIHRPAGAQPGAAPAAPPSAKAASPASGKKQKKR